MLVLNANIRVLKLYAESPKLQNSHFVAYIYAYIFCS